MANLNDSTLKLKIRIKNIDQMCANLAAIVDAVDDLSEAVTTFCEGAPDVTVEPQDAKVTLSGFDAAPGKAQDLDDDQWRMWCEHVAATANRCAALAVANAVDVARPAAPAFDEGLPFKIHGPDSLEYRIAEMRAITDRLIGVQERSQDDPAMPPDPIVPTTYSAAFKYSPGDEFTLNGMRLRVCDPSDPPAQKTFSEQVDEFIRKKPMQKMNFDGAI